MVRNSKYQIKIKISHFKNIPNFNCIITSCLSMHTTAPSLFYGNLCVFQTQREQIAVYLLWCCATQWFRYAVLRHWSMFCDGIFDLHLCLICHLMCQIFMMINLCKKIIQTQFQINHDWFFPYWWNSHSQLLIMR